MLSDTPIHTFATYAVIPNLKGEFKLHFFSNWRLEILKFQVRHIWHNLTCPIVSESDMLEMIGSCIYSKESNQYTYRTIHWNNQSNSMNPK